MELAGAIIMFLASLVFLLSALGILRMPDLYNRIQTGTKATTLGTILMMIGMGIHHPGWIGKLLIILLFIMLTNPVSSHVVARSAHFIRTPAAGEVDQLAERESSSGAVPSGPERSEADDGTDRKEKEDSHGKL